MCGDQITGKSAVQISGSLLKALLAVGNGTYALDVSEDDLAALLKLGLITESLGGFVLTDTGRRALIERSRPSSHTPRP